MAKAASEKKGNSTVATLGVRRSHIDLVVVRDGGQGRMQVHTATAQWRKQSASLASEAGRQELKDALKQLLARERLGNARIRVSLSGDFCVTRVVSGTIEQVRTELVQLEERSALYLSLGTGPKTLAVSIRQIDARRQQALLSVVNRRILDALVHCLSEAGLKAELIEPSLVGLSRVVGQLGWDAAAPMLIVDLSERGVEIGISHQGQLLLDYRPGGRVSPQDAPQIVRERLVRLQRYCQRVFRVAAVKLDQIALCGPEEMLAQVQAGFALDERVSVRVLRPQEIARDGRFADDTSRSEYCPALASCLWNAAESGPNLMDRLQEQSRAPLGRLLVRTLWPVAAALLVTAGLFGLRLAKEAEANGAAAELAAYEPQMARLNQLTASTAAAEDKIRHLLAIHSQLPAAPWHEIFSSIGHSLPDDVWLENLAVDPDGRLMIAGASYGDDGVFEFVSWLKKNPHLAKVALEETRPTTLPSGPATHFDVYCKVAEGAQYAGKAQKP